MHIKTKIIAKSFGHIKKSPYFCIGFQKGHKKTLLNSNLKKKMKDLRSFVSTLTKGTFGIVIECETEPRMRKTDNPYFGRVTKRSRIVNVAIGYDYENVVNNRREREGKATDFVADKPKGKHWVQFPTILASDKAEGQQYLRTTMRANTKPTSVFLLDGKVVESAATIEHIKSFIQSSYKPQNQGLEDGNEVIVRDYKVESVVRITQGEKVWEK